MDFSQLLDPNLLPLVPFLYAIGHIIKAIPKIKSSFIPIILFGISVTSVFCYLLFISITPFSGGLIVLSVIQGTFLAMVTTGTNELIKSITRSFAGTQTCAEDKAANEETMDNENINKNINEEDSSTPPTPDALA